MASTTGNIPVMYLAHEDWSPRFENTFYTVKVEGFQQMKELPSSTLPVGKRNLPAYYYKIKIFCGHQTHIVWRRYSQFQWLYEQLPTSVTHFDEPLILPAAQPCFLLWQPQDDAFAQTRMEDLRDFLRDALSRKGAAQHEAIAQFLELKGFAINENNNGSNHHN